VLLVESAVSDAVASTGTIELELEGEVVPLWRADGEVYAGLIDAKAGLPELVISLRQSPTSARHLQRTAASRIVANSNKTWLISKEVRHSSSGYDVIMAVPPDLDLEGPAKANVRIELTYLKRPRIVLDVIVYGFFSQ
jgi:hypothetical protein